MSQATGSSHGLERTVVTLSNTRHPFLSPHAMTTKDVSVIILETGRLTAHRAAPLHLTQRLHQTRHQLQTQRLHQTLHRHRTRRQPQLLT